MPQTSYQLKIVLIGSKPVIWRRILMPADSSFFDLHVAIQDSFGWEDSHLQQFFTKNPYGKKRDYQRITFPMPEYDEFEEETRDVRDTQLNSLFKHPKDIVYYEYDFGDSWMHKIKLEKILPLEDVEYPTLLDGQNACPPEDCGGLGGYYRLLEVLTNSKHREHKDMMDWMGLEDPTEFDPHAFAKDAVKFRDPKKVLQAYEKGFGV